MAVQHDSYSNKHLSQQPQQPHTQVRSAQVAPLPLSGLKQQQSQPSGRTAGTMTARGSHISNVQSTRLNPRDPTAGGLLSGHGGGGGHRASIFGGGPPPLTALEKLPPLPAPLRIAVVGAAKAGKVRTTCNRPAVDGT